MGRHELTRKGVPGTTIPFVEFRDGFLCTKGSQMTVPDPVGTTGLTEGTSARASSGLTAVPVVANQSTSSPDRKKRKDHDTSKNN